MSKTKETTFYNVTISIPAEPKQAYAKLCDALALIGADWTTDTYSTKSMNHASSTSELFPEISKEPLILEPPK